MLNQSKFWEQFIFIKLKGFYKKLSIMRNSLKNILVYLQGWCIYCKSSNKTRPPTIPEFLVIPSFWIFLITLKDKKWQFLAQENWKNILIPASLFGRFTVFTLFAYNPFFWKMWCSQNKTKEEITKCLRRLFKRSGHFFTIRLNYKLQKP